MDNQEMNVRKGRKPSGGPVDGGAGASNDDDEADILQQLELWNAAGIPRPPAKPHLRYKVFPRELSLGFGTVSAQHLRTLNELLPWCMLRRDYPTAAAICGMLWKMQNLYRLLKPRQNLRRERLEVGKYMRLKRDIVRMLLCTTELLLATGAGSRKPLLQVLKRLMMLQLDMRRVEQAAHEVAVQLLEAGVVDEAVEMLSVRLSMQLYPPGKACRTALLGLVGYMQWMRPYVRQVAADAAAPAAGGAGRSGGGAADAAVAGALPAAPLRAWEHVRHAWSRANSDPMFRDHWRDCERFLREAIRRMRGSTTKLSYYLAQSYCAAGKLGQAVAVASNAARGATSDPDAVALAMLVSQLQQSYREHMLTLEAAAGLPDGSAAAMLGLRLGALDGVEESEKEETEETEETEGGSQRTQSKGESSDSEEEESGDGESTSSEETGSAASAPTAPTAAATLLAAAAARRATDKPPAETSSTELESSPSSSPSPSPPPRSLPRQAAAAAVVPVHAAAAAVSEVHSAVQWQLAALRSDPLSAAALAGLARSGSHCSSCTLSLVQGCLLHLDCCTTGVLASPYEGEAWALLDSALARLAAAAAAAPRETGPDGESAAAAAAAEAGRRRPRKRRREADDNEAKPPEAPAVSLWRQQLQPELQDRAHWWPSAAFSEPPQLHRLAAAPPGAAAALFPAGRTAPPDRALVRHLQHRARVAAVLLGPFNFYTQHVLYEMQLLQQGLVEEREVLREQYEGAAAAAAGLQGVVWPHDGGDDPVSAADLAAVSAALEAVQAGVQCVQALERRLAPAVPPPPLPLRPLPAALLAGVPRSLRRRTAEGPGADIMQH